jgi:hypothetical protein
MKFAFTATFLALIQLTVAQDFVYRFYRNGGCNHTSSAANTFPPFPAPPYSNYFAIQNVGLTTPSIGAMVLTQLASTLLKAALTGITLSTVLVVPIMQVRLAL